MKVSIIIPAHNEENRITPTLTEFSNFFENIRKKEKLDYNIVVIVNGSKDKTANIVKSFSKKQKKVILLDFKEGGKGFAIKEGFKYALKTSPQSDIIGFVDADLATSPKEYYKLIKNTKGEIDGIIATRWHKNSTVNTKQPLLRRILSRGFNFLVRSILLLNFTDTQCGAKVFKREVVSSVVHEIGNTQWAFDIDLLYRAKKSNFNIVEFPTEWNDQPSSKLDVKKVPLEMFLGLLRVRLINSPFRFIIKLYDKLPKGIKIHNKLQ